MDALVIVVLGLIFCLTSQRGIESPEVLTEEQANAVTLEVRTNSEFIQEEHAFEVVAHGLNFC